MWVNVRGGVQFEESGMMVLIVWYGIDSTGLPSCWRVRRGIPLSAWRTSTGEDFTLGDSQGFILKDVQLMKGNEGSRVVEASLPPWRFTGLPFLKMSDL